MRKSISSLLILVLLLGVLAGCTPSGNDEIAGTISGGETAEIPAASEAEDANELDFGEIAGGSVYTNDFAGINFTLPDGWSFATQEQLAEMMGASTDIFAEDQQKLAELAMESTIYDMMASSETGLENVLVMFENTSRNLLIRIMDADAYLDSFESNLDTLQDMDYQVIGRSDVELGGLKYRCLSLTESTYGLYQDVLVRRVGKYMACMTFTSLDNNPTVRFEGFFN